MPAPHARPGSRARHPTPRPAACRGRAGVACRSAPGAGGARARPSSARSDNGRWRPDAIACSRAPGTVAVKPSSSTGTRRRRRAEDRTQHRRMLAPADMAQDLEWVGHRGPVPSEPGVDHLGLAPHARRRRGPSPARPSGRPPHRRVRPPWPRRAWCCRSPSRRRPARSTSSGTAAMPAMIARAQPASLIAGLVVKSRVGRPSATRITRSSAPASRASWLIAAPPGSEVRDHLVGHLGRVGRDAARVHAMPADEHQDQHALEPRGLPALPRRQPLRQLLEPAQRPGGLGQLCVASPAGRGRRGVRAGQRSQQSADVLEIGNGIQRWQRCLRSLWSARRHRGGTSCSGISRSPCCS